jgi:hypothetical protein
MILSDNPGLPSTSTTVRHAVIGYDVEVGVWFPLEYFYSSDSAADKLAYWSGPAAMNPRIWTEFKVAKVTDTTVWQEVPAAGEPLRHTAVPPVMVCPPGCPACAAGVASLPGT